MPKFLNGLNVDASLLTSPLEVEAERWSRLFRRLAAFFSIFIVVTLVLAAMAPIHQAALAPGNISPQQHPSVLQHDEGGIVEEILFREGESVRKGDAIIRLRTFEALSVQNQLLVRRNEAMLIIARLQALLNDERPDFSQVEDVVLIARQQAVFDETYNLVQQTVALQKAKIARHRAELNAARKELEGVTEERVHYQELVDMRRGLVVKGYASRKVFIETQADIARANTKIAQITGRINAMQEILKEAQLMRAKQIVEWKSKWSSELAEVSANLHELNEQISQQRDRHSRLAIRAPFSGRLQGLRPKAVGEVISAGEVIGQVIPKDSQLYASVRLAPKDVAHVSPDDVAYLTISGLDEKKYGKIVGKVKEISPTTASDSNGYHYYQVDIALEQNTIPNTIDMTSLLPGMELQARIVTDKRTLLRYFLRPVFRAIDHAFLES